MAAPACCIVYRGDPVLLSYEKAAIIWDPDSKIQHFIRQASFEGQAKDFGFIVPTPSKPKVTEASASFFDFLAAYEPMELRKGTESAPRATGSRGAELIERYVVGDYEVSVLRAADGASLLDWLKQNDYDSRPAMEEWLDHYAQKKWFFAALKFIRTPDSDSPETSAVRVSFMTNKPHYPYKMPADTWPKGHHRPLVLYFLSPGTVRVNYEGSREPWEADKKWQVKIGRYASTLPKHLKLPNGIFKPNYVITQFVNTENANGYERDLVFETTRQKDARIGNAAFGISIITALALFVTSLREGRGKSKHSAP